MGLEAANDAAIEANHAIGSGCPGPGLDTQLLAQQVKRRVAAGLTLMVGKQVIGENLAVVGRQLDDLDRASLVQGVEKGFGTGNCCCL